MVLVLGWKSFAVIVCLKSRTHTCSTRPLVHGVSFLFNNWEACSNRLRSGDLIGCLNCFWGMLWVIGAVSFILHPANSISNHNIIKHRWLSSTDSHVCLFPKILAPPHLTDNVICLKSWVDSLLLHTFLFLSFWYFLILVSSVQSFYFILFFITIQAVLHVSWQSNLVFLCFSVTIGLHLVVKALHFSQKINSVLSLIQVTSLARVIQVTKRFFYWKYYVQMNKIKFLGLPYLDDCIKTFEFMFIKASLNCRL